MVETGENAWIPSLCFDALENFCITDLVYAVGGWMGVIGNQGVVEKSFIQPNLGLCVQIFKVCIDLCMIEIHSPLHYLST